MLNDTKLNLLARQTSRGDEQAKAKLRQKLDPCLFFMVKHFVATGAAPAPWRPLLQEEYRRVASASQTGKSLPVYLIAQMARNLNDRLVESFQGRAHRVQSSQETVVL